MEEIFKTAPADYFVKWTAYTADIHRDVYPAIDPKSPALSQAGKVVIVTGASSGIGAEGFAPAFADAGAKAVVLVGRRADRIAALAAKLRKSHPSVEFLDVAASVSDPAAVAGLFEQVRSKYGAADVLVNNAAIAHQSETIAQTDNDRWWANMETNLRGVQLMTQGFLKLLGDSKHGVVISLSSGASQGVLPGISSYGISKLAVNRFTEFIAAEYPNVFSAALDPGQVMTEMTIEPFKRFCEDTPALSGGMAVWLSTPVASFLNGRYVATNWDVDEMLRRKDEIVAKDELKTVLRGEFGHRS